MVNHGDGADAPRPPRSAYYHFVSQCRLQPKTLYPNEFVVLSQFVRKCGDKWKVSDD
jgi:hypothetical protein